jgi:glycosyltransferase involved in cell wall biosynthesis
MKKNFFFCPASDYLNQHSETGSHGLLSYYFLRHLAMKPVVKNIFAVVIMSLETEEIQKTTISVMFPKGKQKQALNDFHSLFFYILSFTKFFRSSEYRKADIIHHIIPFKFGRSFNLFFLKKHKDKKYIIGPIFSPHINNQISSDEEYVFIEKKSLIKKISDLILKVTKSISLVLFRKILLSLSLRTFQNADIIFFSDQYSFNYHKSYLKKHQKTAILDTGIDISVFKPLNHKIQNKEKKSINVLFVGRFTKRKGCEYLIRALYEAKNKKSDLKIHCDILGYGPLEKELKMLTKELKLTKDITFLEGVKNEDLISYYRKTDIICIPALSDTCTVIKEGLCSGKPIIVTNVSSHPEKVKSGVNGFVVPTQDSKAIAKILLTIDKKPNILKKLSQNALMARTLYDWNNITDKYIDTITATS